MLSDGRTILVDPTWTPNTPNSDLHRQYKESPKRIERPGPTVDTYGDSLVLAERKRRLVGGGVSYSTIDGATGWQRFRRITLPLLLIAVGPLLIASYVSNFNNFGVIYLFIGGGPPIIGASTQAGHTDILISYVYKLAFDSGGRGVQYGLASALTIGVFIIVGVITLFQYRFTNMWEEASENV